MHFARQGDGRIAQRYFGAHTYCRTAFAGDYTRLEMQHALIGQANRLDVPILSTAYITRILVEDGAVFGAVGFDLVDGSRYLIHADAIILAAGGHTRIWRRSSSRRDENTGDSFRLAVEAGARLRDAELVQFHPSGLLESENAAGTVVSEAARGEGGLLLNSRGERIMARYDPARTELSTRDRVALACYTDVDGLYAIGEAASGLHGANRLGGNSLIELLVYGRIVGQAAGEHSAQRSVHHRSLQVVAQARAEIDDLPAADGSENIRALQRAVRKH